MNFTIEEIKNYFKDNQDLYMEEIPNWSITSGEYVAKLNNIEVGLDTPYISSFDDNGNISKIDIHRNYQVVELDKPFDLIAYLYENDFGLLSDIVEYYHLEV